MNTEHALTDEAIREVFERRARRATAVDLRAPILLRTASMRQAPSLSLRLRGFAVRATPLRVLALAVLMAALLVAGLVVVGSNQVTPEPTRVQAPHETAASFVRPFEYPIPPASNLKLISPHRAMLAFSEDESSTDVYERAEDGSFLPGARGITISSAHAAVTHECRELDGSSRVAIREAPLAFVEDLRAIGGAGLDDPTTIAFDGRPALSVNVDPRAARCDNADFHVEGSGLGSGYVKLNVPARLIVTEVDGITVVLQVWAATEDDLEAWLPTATEFLDSIHFAQQP